MAFSSRQLSLTSDEPPNLGVGYTYLTTGETWYIPSLGQPPLLFAWEAVLVTLSNPHIPLETLTNWHEFPLPPYLHALFPLLGPVEQLEVLGRAPMMLLGMLLGGLVFRWAADLFGAFNGNKWGRFSDLDSLTAFADYKLPQVLRHLGVLRYEDALAKKVDQKTLIVAGSPEEVEIRANTIWAVELIRQELHAMGNPLNAFEIDWILWNLGQYDRHGIKPYHRTITIFY